eukprot:15804_6
MGRTGRASQSTGIATIQSHKLTYGSSGSNRHRRHQNLAKTRKRISWKSEIVWNHRNQNPPKFLQRKKKIVIQVTHPRKRKRTNQRPNL